MTSLPVPEQWTLAKLTDREVAEEIERLINYVDDNGRSVHLPMEFVRHYTTRHDSPLPTVVAIATLPIVLADGGVLGEERGLDEERGISFIIQPEVMTLLPGAAEVTPDAVARAMKFLTDEWLCDVATDYAGKCTVVAAALSIIERSLLDSRPAFFIVAGRRGSGKTTTLIMLIKAVTGIWPAAAAWSPNEEERRKALMSYFLAGVSYILWDNIQRGTQISCPHIERACTSAFYTDRRLGVSESVLTAAGAIQLFTGNAIAPKGDLASRSLTVRLDVDRADPENRAFAHSRPGRVDRRSPGRNPARALHHPARQSDAEEEEGRADEDAVQDVVATGRLGDRACRRSGALEQMRRGASGPRAGSISMRCSAVRTRRTRTTTRWSRPWAKSGHGLRAPRRSARPQATRSRLPIWRCTSTRPRTGRNSLRDAYRACFYPSMEQGETVSPIAVSKRLKTRIGRAGAWRWRNANSQEPEVGQTGPCAGRLLGRGEGRSPGRCADFGGRWWRDSWRCRAVGGVWGG